MRRLLITANSPGEMAGWVRPLAQAWHRRELGPVDILLLPCTFATGQEERVARSLPGVDRVYRPRDYFRLLWRDGAEYRDGALLHLGGDLMYSAFLSWRWRLSTWSYLWARPWWNSAFAGYFTKDDWGVRWLKKRKVPAEKIDLVGDLVLDSVRQVVPQPKTERRNQISYLPGSRAVEVAALAPFFLQLHELLQEQHPGLEGVFHLSPFLPQDELVRLLESAPDPAMNGGVQGRVVGDRLVGPRSELRIAREDGYQQLSRSRMAISLPGTKTAEAAYLRTPVYTMVPLNKPEHLPSIGLLGLLDFIPGGAKLKGRILVMGRDKLGLVALPNIKAQRALLPELVDVIEVHSLAQKLLPILKDEDLLNSVQEALGELFSWDSNPAERIVRKLSESSL